MKKILLLIAFIAMYKLGISQEFNNTQLKIYGHIGYDFDKIGKSNDSYFSIGEQDFFVTSEISKTVSFLGETVVKYSSTSSTKYSPSIERAAIKFDYSGNHSIIIGKIHTPVNTWNDEYHHGRIFFPTIDRPLAFSGIVPMHTLGINMRGQYLGSLNFGYDIVFGNGFGSCDIHESGEGKSIMIGAHIRPSENSRIGVSYYNDYIKHNSTDIMSGMNGSSSYKGPINYEIYSFSYKNFSKRYQVINETGLNINKTDTLGKAHNFFCFNYLGLNIKSNSTLYVIGDYYSVSQDDLYSTCGDQLKIGVGYKYEFNERCCLKAQLEKLETKDYGMIGGTSDQYSIKIQLAYGL